MVAYDYVAGLRDVSHEHGLTTWLENYGHWGFPGEFLMYGGQSDEIAGEFWSEGELGDIENRAATSCGHIYGINKISAESNTCGGRAYSRYPATIKQRGDRFFAEGINNTLLHVFISQPYEDKKPGVNAPFGNEFNRKNTWFSQIDVYLKYLKRVNFMLQQGLNVADVAYFIGEDTPKMTGVTDPPLPVGYQFDYMNAEVIEKYMTVENGLLTLPHGTQYKILVLPELETMRPEVLKKIKQLVSDGGVILGPSPKRSPSLQNQPEADEEVKVLASELWGEVDGTTVKYREFGVGMVLNGMEMQEALDLINCMPDCKLPEENTIHYGHRTLENAEIYFVTNQTNETQDVIPEFRVTNLQPELWDATTGNIRNLPGFEQKENSTAVPLKLEPFESVFIVFRKKAGRPLEGGIRVNYPDANHIIQLNSPWTVRFDPSQRGPEDHVVFDTLRSWTTFSDDRIKYYSGTAIYSNRFQLDQITEGERLILDLGSLTAMAKISVNGNSAGGVWTAPYKLDITPWIKQGTNDLQVEVVNTWVNRLIGDQNLPEKARQTWSPVNPYTADSPLQPSGLLGPVTISSVEYY
ncbi:MAG: glycosyl hydrolase, partial [Bacteroidota bacterium]